MQNLLSLSTLDVVLIVAYFLLIFFVAIKVTDRGKYSKSEDYFLAGKNLGWFLIGASVFASNIGSEHLIGLAGSGASSGVAVAQFEILACFILLILGWFFIPFYMNSKITTVPEFLEKRFSPSARNYLTFVSVVSYVLTKISATIFAGAVVFEAIGFSFWWGAGIVVTVTGVYTIMGGLRAVIYTDAIQMFIMIIGSIILTVLGLMNFDSFTDFKVSLGPQFLSIWRDVNHPDFPWTGILFGAPILGVWYWCTDQYIVQRTLSAANITQARRGTIFAGYLKMLPLFIFVLPGMIAYALAQKGMINLPKADMSLPVLASYILPTGLKGLFIAGLLSALMSSLSSVFNSCSTLITYEVFKRRNPNLSDQKLITIGRVSTVILVIMGLMWIPMMKYISGGLFKYIQSVQAYISPPIAAVFFLGLIWKGINHFGALAALYSGLVLGVLRLTFEIIKPTWMGEFAIFYQMNFLHFAFFLFVLTSGIMIVVSLMTSERAIKFNKKKEKSFIITDYMVNLGSSSTLKVDRTLSIGLVICVFVLWFLFR